MNTDAIRARLAGATPGPWWWEAGSAGVVIMTRGVGGLRQHVARIVSGNAADIDLLVAAPTDLATLLAALDAAQAETARLRAGLEDAAKAAHAGRTIGFPIEALEHIERVARAALEGEGGINLERGARVRVRAYGGEIKTMRVWEDAGPTVFVCSEETFEWLSSGAAGRMPVGVPYADVLEVVEGARDDIQS